MSDRAVSVAVEKVNAVKNRIEGSIAWDSLEKAYRTRLGQAAKTIKMNGYRPGHAPVSLVEKRVGADLRQEIAHELARKEIQQFMEKEPQEIVGQIQFELGDMKAGEPVTFRASFEVFPDVTFGDWGMISVERWQADIQEDDISKMIELLREQNKEYVAILRPAQLQDQVLLDCEGFLVADNTLIAGSQLTDHTVVLGSNALIPGFEEGLVGASAGESRTLNLTFPENYGHKPLAGQASRFEVTVKEVREPKLPELSEEFAEKLGIEGGLSALRTRVRERMEEEVTHLLRERLKKDTFAAWAKANPVMVPDTLKHEEAKIVRDQMVARAFGEKKPPFEVPANLFLAEAEQRVRLGVLSRAFVRLHDLKVDSAEIEQKIMEFYRGFPDIDVARSQYSPDMMTQHFQAVTLESAVLDKVLSLITVTDIVLPYDEVVLRLKAESEKAEAPAAGDVAEATDPHACHAGCEHHHDHDHQHEGETDGK